MKILGINFGAKAPLEAPKEQKKEAHVVNTFGGSYSQIFAISFNGEKNLGEIGPIRDYIVDHEALRLRSWQAYLESEVAQTVINKYVKWVIGSGLKLQSEPSIEVLEQEGINIGDLQRFTETIESRWSIFSSSSMSDYSDMTSLQVIAYKAKLNAIIAGDVLVLIRYVNGVPKYDLVDGAHVRQPLLTDNFTIIAEAKGNKIQGGIEMDKAGRHIAYYVRKGLFDIERIEARSKSTGLVMAFIVYGLEYRLDSNRGIPLITVVMEKLKKMERYSEATLGSAEERQKIAYSIEHEAYSTGQNPLDQQLAKAFNINPAKDDVPVDIDGRVLARNITATTNKQAINMPLGAKLNVLESKNELHFKDFYTVNIDLVCAALGIPPNVAMSKYDANFSASRAALKDWEYTLIVDRNQFDRQFYKTCFSFWFYVNVLNGKIQAPGYIQAFNNNNRMVTEAYTRSRWVGANVPHIDPLKEVNAERAKLGDTGASIPLTTVEAATEALNGGDSKANLNQYSKELKTSKDLGVTGPVNP